MGVEMKVRIINDWQTYPKGAEIDPPAALAEWLILNKRAERIEEPKRRGRPRKVANEH